MKFSSFLHKKLIDIINDHRIVVWYDGEKVFHDFAASFKAPSCEVLSAAESILKTRRRADEIYMRINESDKTSESGYCLLIYIPRRRGSDEGEKMRDPFEVYALAGTAFGDTEDEQYASLARQAMPEKEEEISRLFEQAPPAITLLDGLEKTQKWPLLNEVFKSETPAEIIAQALCDKAKINAVDETPGCLEELLRLLKTAVGCRLETTDGWKELRPKAAEYLLFSEFALDLPDGVPEALSAVPRADRNNRKVVFAACDRMRSDSGLVDEYMNLAVKIEGNLSLPDVMEKGFDPGERDTFPFEEKQLLARAVKYTFKGDNAAAREIIDVRKQSVWRKQSERSPSWTALERATTLLETVTGVETHQTSGGSLNNLIEHYTTGGANNVDRRYRLFENAVTACSEEHILNPVVDLCRRKYEETVNSLQEVFLSAVQDEGWPPEKTARQTNVFKDNVAPLLERRERVVFFMVDSLRYEMGAELAEVLSESGEADLKLAAAVMPTVTDCGMAALLPDAEGGLRLMDAGGSFVPVLGKRQLKSSADRMKLLQEQYGDRFYETKLDELLGSTTQTLSRMMGKDLVVLRTQDPDAIAENLGSWRARRYLSDVVGDIAKAIRLMVAEGFTRVVVSADHGHMAFHEIPAGDVVQPPPGSWPGTKRRCRLGAGLSISPGTITIQAAHLGIQGDVEDVCLPIGFKVFSRGDGYFHGGMSMQEAVVPVILYRGDPGAASTSDKPVIQVKYRSDGFTSRVIGLNLALKPRQLLLQGTPPTRVKVEAYSGTGAKAEKVGEAADCDARDAATREVTLQEGSETPVPVLINPDFEGPEVEIRVSDPVSKVIWARLTLKNDMMD